MVPRAFPPLSPLPRFVLPAASLFLALTGLVGCADHLMNAQVRSAEDFECKRARVRVTEVKSGVFVARGCGQEGAYRCEMGIEGGCRRLLGKAADQAMDLAPEGEGESEEDTEVTTKKKKKKKPASEEDSSGEKSEGGSKKEGSGQGGAGSEKSGSEKSSSEKSGSEKSGSDKGSEKSSSKASSDKAEGEETKPEKKKKKKPVEDELEDE